MKFRYLVYLILAAAMATRAQSFSGHPPGLHWSNLKSGEVNILFPQGLEPTAEKIYHRIKGFYDADTSLGHSRFKLNLVLHNQTVRSNGYVGVGPFISEFYLTPPLDSYVLGSVDWTDALTIHEYRHVLQAMNSRKGIAKWLYILMGEEAWGAAYGLAVPDWFLEGDAVASETRYTRGGRGRMPSFFSEIRALSQSNIQWPYIKSRNGSLKDIVPNEYAAGYSMVDYINTNFAMDTWGKVFEDAVRYKGLFYPFKNALKRHTGLTPVSLYKHAFSRYHQITAGKHAEVDVIHEPKKTQIIRNHLAPNRMKDGSVVCLETGFDILPRLIRLNGDKRIQTYSNMGITTDEDYGFNEPLISWTEMSLDPRWENKNYSDIITYNIRTQERKKITSAHKFLYSSPSNDVSKIVCVEYLPEGQCRLMVIDTGGSVVRSFPMPDDQLATFPVFENGDTTLLAVVRYGGLATLVRYSLISGLATEIIPPVAGIISNPSVNNHDTIFFSSDVSGRDNLFAFDPVSRRIFQLTDDPVGIQQFSITGNEILYNIQTPYGIKIKSVRTDSLFDKPVNYFIAGSAWTRPAALANDRSGRFEIKKAGLWSNPFRVYSWALRPDEGGNVLRVLGRNMLNTIQSSVAYQFFQDDGAQTISGSLALGFTYPVFTAAVGRSFDRSISEPGNSTRDSIRWDETSYRAGVYIPLKWYHHNQIIELQPLLQWGRYDPAYRKGERPNYQHTIFLRGGISLLSYQRRAIQQVSPRYLQQFNISWNDALNHRATSFEISSDFHFPGWSRNDVIEINADYHRQLRSDPYRFPSNNVFISGYSSFTSDFSTRWRVAYHFPCWYPDQGINGILYIKRVRTRLFHEEMNATLKRQQGNRLIHYASSGAELVLDGNGLNVLPVSFGLRLSYLWDRDLVRNTKKPQLEFIVEQLF